jgi:hypothetical protein
VALLQNCSLDAHNREAVCAYLHSKAEAAALTKGFTRVTVHKRTASASRRLQADAALQLSV